MSTRMLWYKAWLDTRWRFLIGVGVLVSVWLITMVAAVRFAPSLSVRRIDPLSTS